MNKKILLTLLFILVPIKVKGICSNEQLVRYKSLAQNIDTYYQFDENMQKFNITIYNISNEFNVTYQDNNITPPSNQLTEIYLNNINPGTNIKLSISPSNYDCSIYDVRTLYVNIPHYNLYYKDPICNNNNNKLCSKWANTTMYNYEQFIDKVSQTKKVEQKPEVPKKEEKTTSYGFFDFLEDYYIIILLNIIVFGSYAIYKLDKKSKFDF